MYATWAKQSVIYLGSNFAIKIFHILSHRTNANTIPQSCFEQHQQYQGTIFKQLNSYQIPKIHIRHIEETPFTPYKGWEFTVIITTLPLISNSRKGWPPIRLLKVLHWDQNRFSIKIKQIIANDLQDSQCRICTCYVADIRPLIPQITAWATDISDLICFF